MNRASKGPVSVCPSPENMWRPTAVVSICSRAREALTFVSCCRWRAPSLPSWLASVPACLAFVLLGACASTGTPASRRGERDWAVYAASVYAMPENQRFALYADAERAYATSRTYRTALRLAILSLAIDREDRDYESTLVLLEFAEGATDDEGDRAFPAFLRSLVRELQQEQASAEAARAERRSLEAQLEALKELEEELNSSGNPR